MAEPASKKRRYEDGAGFRERNGMREDKIRADKPTSGGQRHERFSRSRSRSRDRDSKSRRDEESRHRDRREKDRPREGRRSNKGWYFNELTDKANDGIVDDSRARSRSPARGNGHIRQRTPPRGPSGRDRDRDGDTAVTNGKAKRPGVAKPPPGPSRTTEQDARGKPVSTNGAIDEDEDADEAMKRLMGFGAFRSTKNTKVPGNDKNYGVSKNKKAQYRQYMNRKGGFNRPLSPSR
jgi:U4/U6.U5 tri-snRNP-associated protein 3